MTNLQSIIILFLVYNICFKKFLKSKFARMNEQKNKLDSFIYKLDFNIKLDKLLKEKKGWDNNE